MGRLEGGIGIVSEIAGNVFPVADPGAYHLAPSPDEHFTESGHPQKSKMEKNRSGIFYDRIVGGATDPHDLCGNGILHVVPVGTGKREEDFRVEKSLENRFSAGSTDDAFVPTDGRVGVGVNGESELGRLATGGNVILDPMFPQGELIFGVTRGKLF